ncbi:unnamed protein product [Cuscuta epithymum]|uniref:Uncharacterized protein n=1 Tax=Cuscuta epithymum TaxID=186058 RepID=A0AAV0CSV8_9ASTE|nr:unnamed protein product [Cuscuta epithymum]
MEVMFFVSRELLTLRMNFKFSIFQFWSIFKLVMNINCNVVTFVL